MNGLLLKDWISLRTSIVLEVIVFVFCTALFVPWGASSVAFLIGIAMALLFLVNAMTLDTASRWERYVLALPLSRIQPAGGSGMCLHCHSPAGKFWPPDISSHICVWG